MSISTGSKVSGSNSPSAATSSAASGSTIGSAPGGHRQATAGAPAARAATSEPPTRMRTALATVCISGALEDKLAAAAAAGFDGVEIFEPDFVALNQKLLLILKVPPGKLRSYFIWSVTHV